MALDVYFKEDIKRMVEALRKARRDSIYVYEDPYENALDAILLAFGFDDLVSSDTNLIPAQVFDEHLPDL